MKQTAGIIEHNSRLLAFTNKLGHELTDPLITPMKNGGIVVVSDIRVVHHVFEVTDDRGCVQITAACGYQRLVHMKSDRKGAADVVEVDTAVR